jgi:KaiC/GvpD/RAD55 family RecA-like ATPase
MLDSCLDRKVFEVYVNIKNKDYIADSLMYKAFYKQDEAKKYFEEVKKFIDNNDEKNIINRCKIRD